MKSMGGERLSCARLSWRGIPGDRGWALYDETRGGITSAKRLPPVRECSARYLSEPVAGMASPPAELRFPDGAISSTDSPEASRRLTDFRANVLIDADASAGYPELAWVGRRLRIGTATIKVVDEGEVQEGDAIELLGDRS